MSLVMYQLYKFLAVSNYSLHSKQVFTINFLGNSMYVDIECIFVSGFPTFLMTLQQQVIFVQDLSTQVRF